MMELVEWNDSFSVGNALMDAHHRVFFEMVKEFSNLPDENKHDAIRQRLAFLVEYTVMHLRAEEKLMQQADFPDFISHKAIHDAFSRKVLSIKEAYEKNPQAVTSHEILTIIQDWLINHIMDADKQYTPYVQALDK